MSVVLITGAGTGIGRAAAQSQAALGRSVLLVGRRESNLRETGAAISDQSLLSYGVGDISTAEGVRSVLSSLDGRKIRAIVASAGGQGSFYKPGKTIEEIDQAWTEAFRKNFFSALLLIESTLDQIEDGGRIVLIGSTSGIDGRGGPYASAKGALHIYTKDLCRRVGRRAITVNTVAPGFTEETDFFNSARLKLDTAMINSVIAKTVLGRLGKPSDIIGCVDWLLGENGGWITGQEILVDGGTTLGW